MTDNFRKIDVDKYDEDVISDAELVEPYPISPQEASAQAKSKATEVRSLIGRCVALYLAKMDRHKDD